MWLNVVFTNVMVVDGALIKFVDCLFSNFVILAGQRFIKLAKAPMSPPLAFPFNMTSAGIALLNDSGTELKGAEINRIHSHGLSDRIVVCRI